MDIRKKRVFPIGILHLKDADGKLMYVDGEDGNPDESRPMRVRLHGPGSKVFVEAKQAIEREAMENARDRDTKKKDKTEQSFIDDLVSGTRRVEFLVKVTDGWENVDYLADDGTPLAGADKARAIYKDLQLGYIIDQCDAYTVKWSNFMTGLPAA